MSHRIARLLLFTHLFFMLESPVMLAMTFPPASILTGTSGRTITGRALISSGYRPQGYVYYTLSETETHYFINYTLFFPVDDKRVFESQGEVHENDMENCLIVVEKADAGTGRVVVVEVLGEEGLRKYLPNAALLGGFDSIRLQGAHPPLFVDPKGHSITAFRGDEVRNLEHVRDLLSYEYAGRADDPTQARQKLVGYELVSLYGFWRAAQTRASDIFLEQHDYGRLTVKLLDRGQRQRPRSTSGEPGQPFVPVSEIKQAERRRGRCPIPRTKRLDDGSWIPPGLWDSTSA